MSYRPIQKQTHSDMFCTYDDARNANATKRARHGLLWTEDETKLCCALLEGGSTLVHICDELQRPPDGVLNMLRAANLLRRNAFDDCHYYTGFFYARKHKRELDEATAVAMDIYHPQPIQTTLTPQGTSMNDYGTPKPKYAVAAATSVTAQTPVLNVTYLYGQDVNTCTAEQLIKGITRAQGDVALHKALPANDYSASVIAKAEDAIKLAVDALNKLHAAAATSTNA